MRLCRGLEGTMFDRPRNRNRFHVLAAVCALAMAAGLPLAPASAQDSQPRTRLASKPTTAHKPASNARKPAATETSPYPDKQYFIEFRARSAYSYGHTFLVHGRVGQKITADDVIGLHPFTESSIPWLIGHLIPVPSETGAS